jgi:ribosomal protein L13
MDCGDNVIVVNAAKVLLTGDKLKKKIYYHHTGYIGGIKERTAGAILAGKFPERIVEKAVQRMLPRGPLGRASFRICASIPAPSIRMRRSSPRRSTSRDEPQEHELRKTKAA